MFWTMLKVEKRNRVKFYKFKIKGIRIKRYQVVQISQEDKRH